MSLAPLLPHRYDFVEIEEPSDGSILGCWCGSGTVPGKQTSKGNQIRIRFVSDEYFPSEPGFCIHYSIVTPVSTTLRLSLLDESANFKFEFLSIKIRMRIPSIRHHSLAWNIFYRKGLFLIVTINLSVFSADD